MKRYGMLILAGGVLALGLAPARAAPRVDSAALALCDRVAADPADPDKPAEVPGVAAVAPADVATALQYCKAAAGSTRRALYQLGRAYAASQQTPEAMAAYRKAADKGSTSAMVELGILLATGVGAERDPAQARALFERAADAGNPRGVINLVALADNGGPAIDPARARTLLLQAVQTNSAEAEFQLGLMMARGVGGPQDDVGARAMFEKAAAQNHVAALEWAGQFAQTGRGGPKDENAAKTYYERAAALGDANAKAALERLRCPWVLSDKRGGNAWGHLCF